ncbi:type VI secretion system protein ImpA [Acinetobacter calcoaceticus]|uniref:Type VI secretion system protein ImpA n=1 Tax=Acinetobacter calcoaceticus TaxID=471 RepID=A0A4R1XQL3_ACICA|nr:type VI secretion system protein ImpA [Acinetobacter calcoaceticus]
MNIDLNRLLEPLSDDQPCGEDLSFSNVFHDIRKARIQDDPLLEQGDWILEPKQADWAFVSTHSIELISRSSKDIRLLTWLTEAWSHLYGFQGLSSALSLAQQMLDRYWTQIHPSIEDDDLDQRLGLLQGLINPLPSLLKQISLNHQQPSFNLLDYEKFLYQLNNQRKLSEDNDPRQIQAELDQFDQAIAQSPRAFLLENFRHFNAILSHWQALKQVLIQRMDTEAPSFAQIDAQLEHIQNIVKKIYKTESLIISDNGNTLKQDTQPQNQSMNSNANPYDDLANAHNLANSNHPNGFAQSMSSPSSPAPHWQSNMNLEGANHLYNRQQAMQALQEIADYFALNEPHSPVSYMLQKTMQWHQLPLHEWLAQVIKNENPLSSVHELLGVQTQTTESKDW